MCLFIFIYLKSFIIFIQILKATFHLQLLQNIGFIPCIIQYIPEPILLSVISTASPTRNLMVFSSLGSVRALDEDFLDTDGGDDEHDAS